MGFSFPVVQKAVQRDIDRLGQRVGLVQLANIVGNSAGSLVAGLLLLDLFGTAGTLMLLVAIGLGFAVLQIATSRARAGPIRRRCCWSWAAALPRRSRLLAAPARRHDRAGHRRRGQDRPQPAEDGRRAETASSTSKAIRRAACPSTPSRLPGRHRAADPRRAQARAGDRLRHRRYALCRGPASRDRRVRVIEIVAPVIDTLRRYLDAKAGPASTACSPTPSSRSWSPTAATTRPRRRRATT